MMNLIGIRRYEKQLLILLILIFTGLLYFHSAQTEKKYATIKVGLIFSPSAPYQLRQTLVKSMNTRENIEILCINTGYRVYDNDTRLSSATDKIDQLSDIGVDAVGLVYLDKNEQKECLKALSDKNIPSFVISDTGNTDNSKADYLCYNDTALAMKTASHYIYSITKNKEKVAVLTDTNPRHKRMALAFSNRYCKMAKMDSMNIYAVNVLAVTERFSVKFPYKSGAIRTTEKSNIPGLREIISMSGHKRAAPGGCLYDWDWCGVCDKFFDPMLYLNYCPFCGAMLMKICLPSLGNMKEEQNIDSAISQIEESKTETLYVIGDVAPVMALRRLKLDAHKNVKIVATGCELLTLASVHGGNITANVEPDWRGMSRNFYAAIDSHFGKKLTPRRDSVSYMVKDFRYYSDNSPVELPPGKGARNNIDRRD